MAANRINASTLLRGGQRPLMAGGRLGRADALSILAAFGDKVESRHEYREQDGHTIVARSSPPVTSTVSMHREDDS